MLFGYPGSTDNIGGKPVGVVVVETDGSIEPTRSMTSIFWIVRHAIAINRLSGGIGQTVFYSADGQPWFLLDPHRRDVPLDRISPDLHHAVVAVEDRRFYLASGH